jgi:hypothetical protein
VAEGICLVADVDGWRWEEVWGYQTAEKIDIRRIMQADNKPKEKRMRKKLAVPGAGREMT